MRLKKNNKILVIGNGSGGHFFPSFVVSNELSKLGYEIYYVVSKNRIDENLISKTNFNHIALEYLGLKNNYIEFLFNQQKNIKTILEYIKKYNISIILGFGGGLSFSAAIAGLINKCKVFIHEQNAVLGRANKLLYRQVKMYSSYYLNDSIKVIGNPVLCNYVPNKVEYFDIVIVFGSQGSKTLNTKIINYLKKYNLNYRILFVCKDEIEIKNKNIVVKGFVNNLKDYFYNARLVFTRGGATTLAELSCCDCKVCIIPSPYVTNDHQTKNALAFKNKYGACVIKEKYLNENQINTVIRKSLDDFKGFNKRINVETHNYLDLFIKELLNEIS